MTALGFIQEPRALQQVGNGNGLKPGAVALDADDKPLPASRANGCVPSHKELIGFIRECGPVNPWRTIYSPGCGVEYPTPLRLAEGDRPNDARATRPTTQPLVARSSPRFS